MATDFKYLEEDVSPKSFDYFKGEIASVSKGAIMLEIAFQLKRIADKMIDKNVEV